jgi:hypothetical protein
MQQAEFLQKTADSWLEADLERKVQQLAKVFGWLRYHTLDSRGSDAGFPDDVLVKGSRIIFAENKRQSPSKGRVSDAQRTWLLSLVATGSVEVYVWRPLDYLTGEIEQILRGVAGEYASQIRSVGRGSQQ